MLFGVAVVVMMTWRRGVSVVGGGDDVAALWPKRRIGVSWALFFVVGGRAAVGGGNGDGDDMATLSLAFVGLRWPSLAVDGCR